MFGTQMCGQTVLFIVIANCAIRVTASIAEVFTVSMLVLLPLTQLLLLLYTAVWLGGQVVRQPDL